MKIAVQKLRFGRRAPPCSQPFDPNDTNVACLRKCQHIAR